MEVVLVISCGSNEFLPEELVLELKHEHVKC